MSKLSLYVLLASSPAAVFAQSTFGTVLGTVKDNSGAVVPKAKVSLTDTDENISHATITDAKGDYEFVNTPPGHNKVEVAAAGFDLSVVADPLLVARQTLRVDVGQIATAVQVEATAGVSATDTQPVASSLDGDALLTLPGNVRGRASSCTPPFPRWQRPASFISARTMRSSTATSGWAQTRPLRSCS